MADTRTETDSFGPLEVLSDKYWGAQTQRSLKNFPIGWEKQPVAIVRALGVIKQACAEANVARGTLDTKLGEAIVNGLLTARIGLTAMDQIRPLPFNSLPKPKLKHVATDIAKEFKDRLI